MSLTSISQKSYQLFNPKLREVIRILFDARNEDMPAHRIREDSRIQPDALNLLKDLNLLSEEDGYLSLDIDLIEFLERTLNISEVVSTGRITELSNDSQELYNIYDGLDSEVARRSAIRKIRKQTETIIADFRTTQKDIRRLINQEFRFESSLELKLQQLETYQRKSEEFVNTLELCQSRFDDTETWEAASHPNLRTPRKRLQKQLRIARRSAATIASEILDYIHRAREDKIYLNKLARICDLIERQEYESQSNLMTLLVNGSLARLSRTEPIRTLLPADLNGDEQLVSKLNERAERLGLAQYEQEAPSLETNPDESHTIHIPDVQGIIAAFEINHRDRDLFTFLFDEPINFPTDDMLEENLLETFCLILTTEYSMKLFVHQDLGTYIGKNRTYRYMVVYAAPISNSTPRHELQAQGPALI
jgi:hypothetical protein